MLGRRHEIAWLQSDFFRDQFRKMITWLIMSIVIIFMLLATVMYLIFSKPAPTYYANTTSGKMLNMPKPLSS